MVPVILLSHLQNPAIGHILSQFSSAQFRQPLLLLSKVSFTLKLLPLKVGFSLTFVAFPALFVSLYVVTLRVSEENELQSSLLCNFLHLVGRKLLLTYYEQET
jgi:hypothetical protein